MDSKITAFYRNKQAVEFDFSGSAISSDGAVLLLEKLDRYVSSLAGRKQIIIDIDSTDDPTYGQQQLSMFNGYYGQFMYNELFFHDGETGQIIVPVVRPGNSHSNRWYVGILRRVVEKIRGQYPGIEILIRADSGFSCPAFYELAEKQDLKFALGLASNEVLKRNPLAHSEFVVSLYPA